MAVDYDKYYQTENLFGEPYPELITYFSSLSPKGKLLDLGCGQGRDAIALARLGFEVVGIDYSEVGIHQLNEFAQKKGLSLKGMVQDIYAFEDFDVFDFILLDSMFHFGKKEREQEEGLFRRMVEKVKVGAQITICIQRVGKKVQILHELISEYEALDIIHHEELTYKFEDKDSGHTSETKYEMVTLLKSPR